LFSKVLKEKNANYTDSKFISKRKLEKLEGGKLAKEGNISLKSTQFLI